MDHPVAIGADQSEINELGLSLASLVQGYDVVALDASGAAGAIGRLEVETARLTGELSTLTQQGIDLPLA
ncbi:hypothetical protein [Streptomyces brasiliscabiei]|uniref:hypothetical protein n=1 Tax=Streptomyces brasiliscabiei TaxID=2736302 RepID=UPI0027E125AC|nr:hypothetical protein [Streptomyces brasiliscabiei]